MLLNCKSGGSTLAQGQLSTWARVVFALLIIVSVATILITPDPSDDVLGVLHQHHSFTPLAVVIGFEHEIAVVRSSAPNHDVLAAPPRLEDLLEMVCTHLC
jgi:hypothetical protein